MVNRKSGIVTGFLEWLQKKEEDYKILLISSFASICCKLVLIFHYKIPDDFFHIRR